MRVAFFVDGFNLYHSVKTAEREHGGGPFRWLDIHRLCKTLTATALAPGAVLGEVHYFSALAKHLEARKPDVVRRHRIFISALESTGVEVHLSSFKKKDRLEVLDRVRFQFQPLKKWWHFPISWGRVRMVTHEEKETDVAIACQLLQCLAQSRTDAVVVLTGDTDVAPAIRTARKLYPSSLVAVAFPFHRHNKDLAKEASRSFKLSAELYKAHQFPLEVPLPNGKKAVKPSTW
jgi:uncharacterized LabA/DUF88 family protein